MNESSGAFNLDHFELDDATWGLDVGNVAKGFSEKAFSNGRLNRNLPLSQIGFILGHKGVDHLLPVAHVFDGHPAQDKRLGCVDLGLVNDPCTGENGLSFGNLGLEHALGLLGGIVFGIFAQVPLVAGLGDLL
jgi:hypothetical protein